ncbi:MAG: hypothetical protein ACYC27_04720 [Armatimonadota bacterium]
MDTSKYLPGDISRVSGLKDNIDSMELANTVPAPIAEVGIGIKSEWEIMLKDAATGEIRKHIPWHKNMILDAGLNRIICVWDRGLANSLPTYISDTATAFNHIAVGTGNTPPASTDTGLQAQLLRKQITSMDSTGLISTDPNAPYYIVGTTFTETQANGDLKEVGLVSAVTGGTFFNRDLFKDGDGNPVTITKTSNDLLTVKCRITLKRLSDTFSSYNVTASDGTVHTVKGILTNYGLMRFIDAPSMWSGANGPTAGINGIDPVPNDNGVKTFLGNTAGTSASWQAGHAGPDGGFYRDCAMVIMPSECNGNIAEICAGNSTAVGQSRFTFSPALAKTSTKKLTITMRITLSRV